MFPHFAEEKIKTHRGGFFAQNKVLWSVNGRALTCLQVSFFFISLLLTFSNSGLISGMNFILTLVYGAKYHKAVFNLSFFQ